MAVVICVKSPLQVLLTVLQDDMANPALWVVAGVAISTAVNQGLSVPTGSTEALLKRLPAMPFGDQPLITEALGKLPNQNVRSQIFEALRDPSTSDRHFDLLVDVVCGPAHSGHVSDSILLDLCDRHLTDYKIKIIAGLVETVSDGVNLDPRTLILIRDKWAGSESSVVREQSIVVARLLPVDAEFIRFALNDPAPRVRRSMADELLFMDGGNDAVLDVLAERLYFEEDAQTLASLWAAQAGLEPKK